MRVRSLPRAVAERRSRRHRSDELAPARIAPRVGRLAVRPRDGLAAFAGPADDPRRIARDDGVGGDVAEDDRAGPDQGAAADPNRGHQGRVRADGRAVFHVRAVPPRRARVGRAGMAHVRELRPRPDEHVLPEDDAVPNAGMALDPGPGADDGPARHEAERADDDVAPELGALGDDR